MSDLQGIEHLYSSDDNPFSHAAPFAQSRFMLLDFRQCQAVTEDITIDADVRNGDSDLRFIAMAQSRISSAEGVTRTRMSHKVWMLHWVPKPYLRPSKSPHLTCLP